MMKDLTEKQRKIVTYTGAGLIVLGGTLIIAAQYKNIIGYVQTKYRAYQERKEKERAIKEKARQEYLKQEAIRQAQYEKWLSEVYSVWPIYDSYNYFVNTYICEIQRFRKWSTWLSYSGIDTLGELVYYIHKHGFNGLDDLDGIGRVGKAEIISFFLAYGRKSFVYENGGI